MKHKQLIYIVLLLISVAFLPACGSSGTETNQQVVDTKKMSGAEILQDAKEYADQQCRFKIQENLLKNNPSVKDYEIKMNEIKLAKNKIKNYYLKKYKDLPEEQVAFKRAVKAARMDSEICNSIPKRKKK